MVTSWDNHKKEHLLAPVKSLEICCWTLPASVVSDLVFRAKIRLVSADVEEIWGSWYVMSIFLLGRCPTPIAIGSMPKYPMIFPVEACFPTLSEA